MPDAAGPRTLFVCHTASLGGAELTLLDVAAGLEDVRVLLFEDGPFGERLRARGVAVESVQGDPSVLAVRRDGGVISGLRAAPGVVRLIAAVARRARGADVLYANSQKAFVVSAIAGRLARRPVVWQLHDILTPEHFSPSRLRLAVWLGNRFADRIVVGSNAIGQAFADAGGDSRKVRLVYYGIDPAPFEAVQESGVEAVRREFGLGSAPVVGVFSRLGTWKGQHVLIESLPRLPGVHALFVGAPLFGEEPYAETLRQRASALGVSDRVHWAGFRDDIPTLMRACAVVAHTSTAAEPFGRVIVEGMLAGQPVVATDAGGAREIVDSGRTGWLVPPGDPAALAAAIDDVLADPEASQTIAAAGRAAARGRFSRESLVRGAGDVIAEVG